MTTPEPLSQAQSGWPDCRRLQKRARLWLRLTDHLHVDPVNVDARGLDALLGSTDNLRADAVACGWEHSGRGAPREKVFKGRWGDDGKH